MALKRTQHWATRALNQYLLSRATMPHSYPDNDCCSFAAGAIHAMTGVDIAEDFKGYATELGALKAIKTVTGGNTVEHAAEYVATKYGLDEWKAPLCARRGDLALIDRGDGELAMGIVHLSGNCVVAPGATGLMRRPLTAIKRSWHV